MVKNLSDVNWCLKKAEEYLESAKDNIQKERLYPAAEEIFKCVETLLEALLYFYGVKKIEYPGRIKKFSGRLALQFLIRDVLVKGGKIEKGIYEKYLTLASELHFASYRKGKYFEKEELKRYLDFAKELLIKVKYIVKFS